MVGLGLSVVLSTIVAVSLNVRAQVHLVSNTETIVKPSQQIKDQHRAQQAVNFHGPNVQIASAIFGANNQISQDGNPSNERSIKMVDQSNRMSAADSSQSQSPDELHAFDQRMMSPAGVTAALSQHPTDWLAAAGLQTPSTSTADLLPELATVASGAYQNNNIQLGLDSIGNQPTYLRGHQREFNDKNQLIYEGPATAQSIGDFYYPQPPAPVANLSEPPMASNVWWTIGFGRELERVSNLTHVDYLDYCDTSPTLVSQKQRSLCRLHPRVMSIVARGLKLAVDECQSRFAGSRWNCSLLVAATAAANRGDNSPPTRQAQVFGEVMRKPNRERSFLNAIIAAGLAHAMTSACSQGELPDECSCDKRIRSKTNRGKVEWVACSDDIDYGARFSRDFTDNLEGNESDAISTIYMHNNEVGRRVFKSATEITCTCPNGDNVLCPAKRCWKHLGSFSDVGDELMRRYESATHVQRSNKDPHKLRPVRRGVRKPKRKDLVYIDESPDYCQPETRLGVLGTQNRRCNSTSAGPDNCSLLCCGRGYQVVVEEIEEDCNCKFVWCCHVKCERCKRHIANDICN